MSNATGKLVIAEGVETREQAARLRRMGCEHGQGYLFARPLSANDLRGWMRAMPDRPASPSSPDVAGVLGPATAPAGDLVTHDSGFDPVQATSRTSVGR